MRHSSIALYEPPDMLTVLSELNRRLKQMILNMGDEEKHK